MKKSHSNARTDQRSADDRGLIEAFLQSDEIEERLAKARAQRAKIKGKGEAEGRPTAKRPQLLSQARQKAPAKQKTSRKDRSAQPDLKAYLGSKEWEERLAAARLKRKAVLKGRVGPTRPPQIAKQDRSVERKAVAMLSGAVCAVAFVLLLAVGQSFTNVSMDKTAEVASRASTDLLSPDLKLTAVSGGRFLAMIDGPSLPVVPMAKASMPSLPETDGFAHPKASLHAGQRQLQNAALSPYPDVKNLRVQRQSLPERHFKVFVKASKVDQELGTRIHASGLGKPTMQGSDFTGKETTVYFYHAADRPAALRLADTAGGIAIDLTGLKPAPPLGRLDLYLSATP